MTAPTIAVALGGGGARGLAHIHALRALDDLGITPVALAGTSIGAIMAAAYASGMSGEETYAYTEERFRQRFKLIADLMRVRPRSARKFLAEGRPRIGELNLERMLEKFLPPKIALDFSELRIPLQIIATDYYKETDRVFSSGPVRPALAASAALPALFRPVVIDGDVFIDGGMTNPTPFDKLQGLAEIIVAIDVSGGTFGEPGERPAKIDSLYAASQLMQKSIVRAKAECYRTDIFLQPDVARFRVLDFLKAKTVLEATEPLREELKVALDAAISNWNSKIG